MRALSGARCTGVRLYTLWIKIGTNQRALGEHSHYWTRLRLLSTCSHATVSVPCLFLTVWLVGLQNVIVVFSGLLGLRIALTSPPARSYTWHIVNRIAFRLKKDGPNIAFKSWTALTNILYAKNSWRHHYVHAISWAPQIITYMTVNVLHVTEQSDNFKKTVAEVQKHLNPHCLQCWKRDTSNSDNIFACWVILHAFLKSAHFL